MITTVDPSQLRLTPHDDEIYTEFKKDFSDLKIDYLEENEIKTEKAKFVRFKLIIYMTITLNIFLYRNGDHFAIILMEL